LRLGVVRFYKDFFYFRLYLPWLCLPNMVDHAHQTVNVISAPPANHGRRHIVAHPRPGSTNHPISGPQRRPRPIDVTPDDYDTVYLAVYHGVSVPVAAAEPRTRQQLPRRHSTDQLLSK